MSDLFVGFIVLGIPLIIAIRMAILERRIDALEKALARKPERPRSSPDHNDFADYLLSRSGAKDVPGDVARPARENRRRWTGGRT